MVDSDRLRALPIFASLSDAERNVIAACLDEVDVPPGEQLISEGDYAYEFFVIEQGTADVRVDGSGIAELGPGDFFGEIGLLLTGRRTASVRAASQMRMLAMFDQNFRRIERTHPAITERLRKALRERFPVRAR